MPDVHLFSSADAPSETLRAIRALLELSFDGDFSADDWTHTTGGHHVTVMESGSLVAHAAVIARTLHLGERAWRTGYVEGVATRPDARGRGFGSLAMSEIANTIRTLYEVGALSTDRWGFYERLGWERWRGPSYVRSDEGLVRTEDEDDGLMILRFGEAGALDLTASICCETRSGDDW